MALQLSVTSPQGVTANHWVVTRVILSPEETKCQVELCLFKDSAAYTNGDTPLTILHFFYKDSDFTGTFDLASLDPVNKNPYDAAQDKIKLETAPYDFTTATEV